MGLKKSYITLLIILLTFLSSCGTVPVTGRRQLSFIPSSKMLSMSFQQYKQFMETNRVSPDIRNTQMVKRVGRNIQNAVEQYLSENNMSVKLKDYRWEFNLIDNTEPNAWAMPGGKVVVYSGILDATRDETGLAVVMGHEIAHAIAEHGRERMSQQLIAQMGSNALSSVLKNSPAQAQEIWMSVFGAGAQYGALLPFGRLQESEADHLGLIFMAMAGYDPNKAVDFWTRMSELQKGQTPPEFMSTHPSDETRIRKINQTIPEAMKYYQR